MHFPIALLTNQSGKGLLTFSGGRTIADDTLHDIKLNIKPKMKQEKHQKIVDIRQAQKPSSQTFAQNFQILNNHIAHQNKIQVRLTQDKSDEMNIKNYFVRTEDNFLNKITQIHIQDRIITITDTFSSAPGIEEKGGCSEIASEEKGKQKSNGKKNLIGRKCHSVILQNGQEQIKPRDIKNVVKNTVRLFQGWIEECTSPKRGLSVLLSNLFKQNGKYNNSLMISISKNKELRQSFLTFCESDCEERVSKSKINDKESQLLALKRYQAMFSLEDGDEGELMVGEKEQNVNQEEEAANFRKVQKEEEDQGQNSERKEQKTKRKLQKMRSLF